jgi:hypothetical protein
MSTVFWGDAEGVILLDMSDGQTIHSDLYIQILKTLQKRFRRVRPHRNVAEILLQHDIARPHTSPQKAITELGLFFPTHHTAQILLPQISTSLKPSKMPSVGKSLGLIKRLLKN